MVRAPDPGNRRRRFRRAIAERVRNEDGALGNLPDVVALHRIGEGKPCEKPAPVESPNSNGSSHAFSHVSDSANRSVRADVTKWNGSG